MQFQTLLTAKGVKYAKKGPKEVFVYFAIFAVNFSSPACPG
jgi:hypothetical protein